MKFDRSQLAAMDRDDCTARMAEISVEVGEISRKHRPSRDDERRARELGDEFDELKRHRERLDFKRNGFPEGGRYKTILGSTEPMEGDDRYNGDRAPDGGLRSRAMRRLDQATRDDTMSADVASRYEKLLGTGTLPERSWIASYIEAAGDPNYLSAFAKKVADPDGARDRFTNDEAAAVRRVHQVAEQRAMTVTDTQGGFLIPAHLDPAVLLSSSGFQNPIREMARVVQIAGDVFHGVSSEGASANWAAEADEANDDSPTLAQPNIPVYKGHSFVPYSVEIEGDGAGFVQEVSRLLVDAIQNLWAAAYTTGTGVGQPTGFVTALAGAGAPVVVDGDGSEELDDGDPVKLQNLLPPRAQANSAWAMALPTINKLRFAETSNGALLYPSLQNDTPTLLGRRVYEVSNMDSVVNASATENNYLIALGDWSRFVIVDRVGTSVELVAHLFGANRRPTGQRGFYAWFRTGSSVVTTSQFRLLNVPTTA